uniref:Si:ch73-127m5.3 n=1 Tax=Electrophorus electricus TaxID=8005 RepID=A0A4W4DRT9_ELEEL
AITPEWGGIFYLNFYKVICLIGFCIAAEKVNTRGCANLTLVLDNWKFAIMTQVKDLLLNDHNTVLPDYRRLPLSEALNDLYKEFNTLKERLGELTTKFEGVESFLDDFQTGRSPTSPREDRPKPGTQGNPDPEPDKGPRRKNRVVVFRRVKMP